MEVNKIYQGDCLEIMKKMKENSIDTIITDAPYGLSFMGKKWDYDVPSIEIWKECLRVLKHGGTALIFAGSRTQHRMAINVEDAGFILKDTIMWLYGSGFPKSHNISINIDKTISKESQLWKGWHSHGLKPAYEPILVCQKPNEGTYAENALKYGVAGLNIDGGRIGKKKGDRTEYGVDGIKRKNSNNVYGKQSGEIQFDGTQGRFPANIILDEEAGKMLDEQSGVTKSNSIGKGSPEGIPKNQLVKLGGGQANVEYLDKGGASRFFYCAKASKSERNAGCEKLGEKQKIFNGQSGQSSEDMKGVEQKFTTQPSKNHHPTVKPLALMEYLCTLTKTPTGGIVLDPFIGSGTTLLASKNTGREYIGIEREKEYIEIAEARLKGLPVKLF